MATDVRTVHSVCARVCMPVCNTHDTACARLFYTQRYVRTCLLTTTPTQYTHACISYHIKFYNARQYGRYTDMVFSRGSDDPVRQLQLRLFNEHVFIARIVGSYFRCSNSGPGFGQRIVALLRLRDLHAVALPRSDPGCFRFLYDGFYTPSRSLVLITVSSHNRCRDFSLRSC